MRHYVTACRAWQLPVLVGSMRRHCAPFKLHVLAWDFGAEDFAGHYPEVEFRTRPGFLFSHPAYAKMPGEPRSTTDAVCTARWAFAHEVMRSTGYPVTLIDGDQFFWSSPEPAFREIPTDAWMALSPHRFIPMAEGRPGATFESHRRFGLYNCGWVYLASEWAVLEMAKMTLDWCYTGFRRWYDRDLFGDQGYVELLKEELGDHAYVFQHPGLNVGPWNVHRYGLMRAAGLFVVDPSVAGDNMWPVITYHYSSLRFGFDPLCLRQIADPGYDVNDRQMQVLYAPYVEEVFASRGVVFPGDLAT